MKKSSIKANLKVVVVCFAIVIYLSKAALAIGPAGVATSVDSLKKLSTKLHEKYLEMDGYIDVLLMALLMEQHLLAFGGPGGSKTQTAKDILRTMKGKKFSLQFSPSSKQEQIV